MYTEQSIRLKSDFYARYGETKGELYFEKTGLPCTLLDGGTHLLVFSLGCGVRAYGRGYGDILRVLDTESNVCDVHFTEHGKGAQVLYRMDIPNIKGMKDTALYTINKLLLKMGSTGRVENKSSLAAMCDRYAPNGWCAVKEYDEIKSAPLPLSDYNVILIQVRKNGFSCREEDIRQFAECEKSRVEVAAAALRDCRTDVLFEMVNESQKGIERVLLPKEQSICAVRCALQTDGVTAARICDCGIISFCEKSSTDSAIHSIRMACERNLGYSARVSVVK